MSDKCFVDTNILVDARDAGAGVKHTKADALIRELWATRSGRLSVQVLNKYFVTVTRKLRPGLSSAEAWADMESLRAWEPVAMDWRLLEKGRKIFTSHSLSWRDSLILAAAETSGANILYSEDLQHGATYGGVTVVNPFASA